MKKVILVLAAVLGLSLAAVAQPKAVGLRGGFGGLFGGEVSYEHWLGAPGDFLEAELGSFGVSGFRGSAIYNFTFAQPDWTDRGTWAWYAGPGAAIGIGRPTSEGATSSYLGIVGQIGLEYTFWFPLQLSLDVRPALAYFDNNIYTSGIFGLALAVRYAF